MGNPLFTTEAQRAQRRQEEMATKNTKRHEQGKTEE
jgi:hypothetical protein